MSWGTGVTRVEGFKINETGVSNMEGIWPRGVYRWDPVYRFEVMMGVVSRDALARAYAAQLGRAVMVKGWGSSCRMDEVMRAMSSCVFVVLNQHTRLLATFHCPSL